MHVFGEKLSESNSMWKPYPDPHNFEEISKQRSILFHFRTLTSRSIFSSQNNRSGELSHTLITDLLELAFAIPVEIYP